MTSIILIQPEHSGNIGAVCRVMKNFGFKDLVLIEPKCEHLNSEAIARSKHAKDILEKAKVKDFSFLEKFDYLVATTSQLGSDYNIPRSPLNPEQLADKINGITSKIGIVFGREGEGLSNKEIKMCDFVVTVPTSVKYPALNLSHSVAIVLYELFKTEKKHKIDEHITPISKKDKEQLLKMVNKVLDDIKFTTEDKRKTQKMVWTKIIGKSMMTKREAFALMGFFRKLI